jgi:hypothetical protein
MANTFTAIRTLTVTGSAADIQFTNIPQTYTDLYVAITVGSRVNTGSIAAMVVYTQNGQSATLSNWRNFRGLGTTVSSNTSAYPIIGEVENNSSTNYFSSTMLYISGYTSNANKQIFLSESATGVNSGLGTLSYNSLIINETAPISFIGFGDGSNGGGFKVGSTATLYGINKNP